MPDAPEPETIHEEALEVFKLAVDKDKHNRDAFEEDVRFARLEEQWEGVDKTARAGRPCLTVNLLSPIIRQVVNDSRQNKPAIKVQPQDSVADPETAEIISGLIRNIETSSDADIAYDTAVDNAVSGGFGYFRINLAYACDDNWEQDIVFEAIPNPLSVIGDPHSTKADGSDWNVAFITDLMTKRAFKKKFPQAEDVDFDAPALAESGWVQEGMIRVAEYWVREEVKRQIVLLSNGEVVDLAAFEKRAEEYAGQGITVEGEPREVMSYRVTQHLMSGAEILQSTPWAGKFIPIVPVYGDEVNLNGKRHFRSLIRSGKDAQRIFNYENSVSVELSALAPKTPFIGPKGAFKTDVEKWETINSTSHPFVEYDGGIPPQRQPFNGPPIGSMQSAETAAGWVQKVTGIYNASLGAPSNETSGKAIMARQREGDVSTFHFIDNLARSIRHGARILIDLIPKVYTPERVVRVLGEDGKARTIALNQPTEVLGPDGKPKVDERGQAISKIYDLSIGKYDLTVSAGPSFTTRREEAATQMVEFVRAFPAAAPLIGDILARNLDWPGAAEIEQRLREQREGGGEHAAQLQAMQQQISELTGKLDEAMKDRTLEERKLMIDEFKAETQRMQAMVGKDGMAMDEGSIAAVVAATVRNIIASPDILSMPAPAAEPTAPPIPNPYGAGQPSQ